MPNLENAANGAVMRGERRPTEPIQDRPLCEEKKEWKPSRKELLRQHEINIGFLDVGYIIRVGCKSFAFKSVEEAINELNMYVADPHTSIEKWNKIFNANE